MDDKKQINNEVYKKPFPITKYVKICRYAMPTAAVHHPK